MESIDSLRTYCDCLEGAAIDDNHVSAEYVTVWAQRPADEEFVREEVVRCKECKYCKRREGILPPTVCERWGYYSFKTEPDRFCAWGKRRSRTEHEGA